jgi:hypothetical protein
LKIPETFGKDIAKLLDDMVEPLIKRIALEQRKALLEARVHDLEARGEIKYCGIWQPDQQYQRGNFVTLNGGMWHAEQRTTSRPGTDSTWKLAVKSAGR